MPVPRIAVVSSTSLRRLVNTGSDSPRPDSPGPVVVLRTWSQRSSAQIGSVAGCGPRATPAVSPRASGSVLERRISSSSPADRRFEVGLGERGQLRDPQRRGEAERDQGGVAGALGGGSVDGGDVWRSSSVVRARAGRRAAVPSRRRRPRRARQTVSVGSGREAGVAVLVGDGRAGQLDGGRADAVVDTRLGGTRGIVQVHNGKVREARRAKPRWPELTPRDRPTAGRSAE